MPSKPKILPFTEEVCWPLSYIKEKFKVPNNQKSHKYLFRIGTSYITRRSIFLKHSSDHASVLQKCFNTPACKEKPKVLNRSCTVRPSTFHFKVISQTSLLAPYITQMTWIICYHYILYVIPTHEIPVLNIVQCRALRGGVWALDSRLLPAINWESYLIPLNFSFLT